MEGEFYCCCLLSAVAVVFQKKRVQRRDIEVYGLGFEDYARRCGRFVFEEGTQFVSD